MRIILIPGFAEDELIFSRMLPLIEGDKVVLNSWKLLGNEKRAECNVVKFASEFIDRFKITRQDILIGHSMGGWIAYHVKHLVGCRIVQIASLTNTNRIIPPAIDHPLLYWAVRQRLVFNPFTTWLSSFGGFHDSYSREIFLHCARLLQQGNTENIVNQLKILLKPIRTDIRVQPDLRIHSKQDPILRPPLENYYPVPGDHFNLYSYPHEVSVPVNQFLATL
jgi:pimeloyl-ACP methyl ester carboxylesterase